MKSTTKIAPQTCPKCGKVYTAPPALSRVDNRTAICPDCGIRESLVALGCSQEEQEHILQTIHGFSERRHAE